MITAIHNRVFNQFGEYSSVSFGPEEADSSDDNGVDITEGYALIGTYDDHLLLPTAELDAITEAFCRAILRVENGYFSGDSQPKIMAAANRFLGSLN